MRENALSRNAEPQHRLHRSGRTRDLSAHGSFVDIHCHLLPSIDDGAKSWEDSLAMAQMAVADGTELIIATPHQLGSYGHNTGDVIRAKVAELNSLLEQKSIPLKVLPGGDVRIDFIWGNGGEFSIC